MKFKYAPLPAQHLDMCNMNYLLKMSFVLWIGLFYENKQTYTYLLERHADPPNLKGTPGEPSKCLSLP